MAFFRSQQEGSGCSAASKGLKFGDRPALIMPKVYEAVFRVEPPRQAGSAQENTEKARFSAFFRSEKEGWGCSAASNGLKFGDRPALIMPKVYVVGLEMECTLLKKFIVATPPSAAATESHRFVVNFSRSPSC